MPRRVVVSSDDKLIDADKIVWVNVDDSREITVKLVSGDTQRLVFKTEREMLKFINEWEDD